jgi:hypothetical protein
MKTVCNLSDDADWGLIPYIQTNLDKLSEESEDVFFNGAHYIYHKEFREQYKDYKRRCLLANWSPCELLGKKDYFHFDMYEWFTDVYCVCPFTCNFMNTYFGEKKFKYIPYPFTNNTVRQFYNYDALCSWFGSICGQDHIKAIETISKYPHKFITSQKNTWMHHPYEYNKCTHVNLTTENKLIEVSKCRSSLTFNKLYLNSTSQDNWCLENNENKAFEHFHQGIMPQFKVRTHEIASCKSLILCYRDPWNLIEDFYEPNTDFIYFSNFEELDSLLKDIDKNFNKYARIIENGYNKQQNYTVESIFKYIKTNDASLINWKLHKE